MNVTEAEKQLTEARQSHTRSQRALSDARLAHALVRSKIEPLRAELARLAALPEVSSEHLVAQTNAERALGRLDGDAEEAASAVADAEADVHSAAAIFARAEQALATARLAAHEAQLLERMHAMEAELAADIETLDKLRLDAGLKHSPAVRPLVERRNRPNTSVLVLAGEAMRLARELRDTRVPRFAPTERKKVA